MAEIFIIINFNIITMIIITIKGVGERPEITPSDDEFKPVQRDVSGACKTQNTKETQKTKHKRNAKCKTQKHKTQCRGTSQVRVKRKTQKNTQNTVQRDLSVFFKTQNGLNALQL